MGGSKSGKRAFKNGKRGGLNIWVGNWEQEKNREKVGTLEKMK